MHWLEMVNFVVYRTPCGIILICRFLDPANDLRFYEFFVILDIFKTSRHLGVFPAILITYLASSFLHVGI